MESGSIVSQLALISPLLVLCFGAFALLLIDVFMKRDWPRDLFTMVAVAGAALCLFQVGDDYVVQKTIFSGLMYADPFARSLTLLILGGTAVSVLLGSAQLKTSGIESPGEYYSLLLMATAGALIFVSAAEFVTIFIGLEIMSMALYCLCASALDSRRSSESALKYFLLGSFSSAFLLYGIALIYGLTGTTVIPEVVTQLSTVSGPVLLVAIGLIVVGLVFKVGAVPFHFWAPDVYQGAPTPVTVYMACVIKAAAVGAALRVLWVVFGSMAGYWTGAIALIAVVTMIVGNIVALQQRSMKRMLAYSSIAHAGYMLVGFLAMSPEFGGGAAIFYYLVLYSLMSFGAFGVLMALSAPYASSRHPDDISRFQGLGDTHPFLAALMTLFLLSLAGLPPGIGGLVGKFYIFNAAVKAQYVPLAIVGVLCSAVSCYYYLRVIVAMYFMSAAEKEDRPAIEMGLPLAGTLIICAIAVVTFGIFPESIYAWGAAAVKGLV